MKSLCLGLRGASKLILAAMTFLSFPALAAETYSIETTTSAGLKLTLAMPLQAPLANIKQGALVCGESTLTVKSAKLWMEHDHGFMHGGHAGPAVSTKTLDSQCFLVNEIFFPHSGEWQIKIALEGGDEGTFTLQVADNSNASIYFAQGTQKSTGSLTFNGDIPSGNSRSGAFCTNEKSQLVEAVLWMPDMGHGSSPTALVQDTNGCTKINDIDFFMGGKWEIRAQLESGEKFVFAFDVKE